MPRFMRATVAARVTSQERLLEFLFFDTPTCVQNGP